MAEYTKQSTMREREYIRTNADRDHRSTTHENQNTLEVLTKRCDKLETVLALVTEHVGMGHRTGDGDLLFTAIDSDASSLHKSRRRGNRYMHISVGSGGWDDETRSN